MLKEASLGQERRLREELSQSSATKLAGKSKMVEDLTRRLDDGKDEIKTLKRKHQNNVKVPPAIMVVRLSNPGHSFPCDF